MEGPPQGLCFVWFLFVYLFLFLAFKFFLFFLKLKLHSSSRYYLYEVGGGQPWGRTPGVQEREAIRERGPHNPSPPHTHLFARVRFVCVLVVSEINIFKSFAHSLYLGGILFLPH